jgi:hypothetical protein
MEAAHAVGVTHDTAGRTQILLDAAETRAVHQAGNASQVCPAAINTAIGQGITFTDEQRHVCATSASPATSARRVSDTLHP